MGDRTIKFGRSKVDGHVQNSGPAISNRKQVVHNRTTSRAGSYHQSCMIVANESREWSGDWTGDRTIGRAIGGTVSRLMVRSITISDD